MCLCFRYKLTSDHECVIDLLSSIYNCLVMMYITKKIIIIVVVEGVSSSILVIAICSIVVSLWCRCYRSVVIVVEYRQIVVVSTQMTYCVLSINPFVDVLDHHR